MYVNAYEFHVHFLSTAEQGLKPTEKGITKVTEMLLRHMQKTQMHYWTESITSWYLYIWDIEI